MSGSDYRQANPLGHVDVLGWNAIHAPKKIASRGTAAFARAAVFAFLLRLNEAQKFVYRRQ